MMSNKPQFVTTNVPHWLQPPKQDSYPVYAEWTFEETLRRLAGGMSLQSICREDPAMPQQYGAYLRWIHADPERKQRYYDAQEIGTEVLADRAMDIADGTDNPMEDVQRSKLRVDYYKWIIGTRNRNRYGDKKQIEQNVNINIGEAMDAASKRVIELRGDDYEVVSE